MPAPTRNLIRTARPHRARGFRKLWALRSRDGGYVRLSILGRVLLDRLEATGVRRQADVISTRRLRRIVERMVGTPSYPGGPLVAEHMLAKAMDELTRAGYVKPAGAAIWLPGLCRTCYHCRLDAGGNPPDEFREIWGPQRAHMRQLLKLRDQGTVRAEAQRRAEDIDGLDLLARPAGPRANRSAQDAVGQE